MARPHRHGAVYLLRSGDAVALVERPAQGLLGGMAGLPTSAWLDRPLAPEDARAGAPVGGDWRRLGSVEHVFTHFSLTLDVYEAEMATRLADCGWVDVAVARDKLPTVFRKALDLGGSASPPTPFAQPRPPRGLGRRGRRPSKRPA